MVNFLRLISLASLFALASNSVLAAITILDPVSGLPTNAYTLTTICQGASVEHCINVSGSPSPTAMTHSGSIGGTITISPPTNPGVTCFRYTAPFSFVGNNVITFTVSNSLGETAQVQITIRVVNQNTPIDAGPNQFLCSSVLNQTSLSAVNPDPLVQGYWTVFVGPGVISGGTDSPHLPGADQSGGPNVNVTGLQLGANIFRWNQVYPCATTFDLVTVYVYNGTPPVADANICYPSTGNHSTKNLTLCGTTSYTLCANSPGTAATGTWNIFGGCGTIYNINNASAEITNLCAGCNNLEWTISNGTCPGGDTKDTITICVYPTIQQALTGADITRCLGSPGSIVLSGNFPTGANTGLWTFVSGPVTPNIVAPGNASTNVTGLTQPGVYQFNWTITSGPCGSSVDPMFIYMYSPSSPVNAGIDQNICLPNNSTTMAATSPISPAVGTWTVVAGAGSFGSPNSPTSGVSGLGVGLNTFRWTVANGTCANNNSFDDVSVFVYPASQPPAAAGPDQNLSYSGSPVSTTLAGNTPIVPGVGTWSVSGPSVPVFSPNNQTPGATISNLIPGTYTLTWSIENGGCGPVLTDQMQIFVYNCASTTINAGADQSFCTPINNTIMNAQSAPSPAVGTWTIIQGGGSISAVNSPTTAINNIPAGVNIYRWTINNGTCGTYFDEVIVNIHSAASTVSNAGPDQEFCSSGPGLSVVMAATPVALPATGSWSGPGTIASLTNPSTTVSNLPIGLHNFTWTVNNGPCGIATDVITVRVYSQAQTQANAGVDQQLCSNANNTTVVANSLIVPATGVWQVVSGGGTIASPNTQATAINNIPVGHNVFRWTINNGPCSAPAVLQDLVSIDVFDINQPAANAGADQNVCSTSATVTLNGNGVTIPAVGTWTVSPVGPNFSSVNAPNAVVSGLTPGTTYTFTWTINNGTCGTTADAVIVNYFNSAQPPANAGSDIPVCLPQNSVVLNGNVPDSPATGTWSLISGPNIPTFTAGQFNTTLSNLVAGTYVMRWTINNGSCTQAITFDDVSVIVFSNNQTTSNAGPDQEICEPVNFTTLTGNNIIAPAIGTWSQISGPNTATINNPNLSQVNVSGLIVGCYVFRWSVSNGDCIGGASSDDVSVCVFDNDQPLANAGPDQNICTPSTSATLAANNIITPAVGTWTVVSGPNTPTFTPNINASNAVLGNLIIGTYVLQWEVDNGSCNNANTSDQVVIKVFDSTSQAADAGSLQELCSPAHTVTMVANAAIAPAVGTWTVVSGTGSIVSINNPESSITNIPVGINCFRWTIDNGGCGVGTTFDEVCVNVYSSNQLSANAGTDQDICTPLASVTMAGNNVTTPATGQWQQISGPNTANIVNASLRNTEINNLVIGCYQFSWTIDNGVCAGPVTTDIVEICVYPGGFPAAFAGDDMEICTPLSEVVMNADAAISPGEGTWTLVSGPNTPTFSLNDPLTSVTDLVTGVYVFDWSLNYSSCGSESDEVTITVYDSNQGAAVAGDDEALCTPSSSVVLNAQPVIAPGYGTWSLATGDVDFVDIHNPTTTAFNIPAGTHTLVWTIYNGDCLADELTTDTMTIVIHDSAQQPSVAGLDQSICTPQSTVQLQGTPLLNPATGVWTSTSSATIVSPNSNATSIDNLQVGVHTFCWTIDNGECSPPSTSDCVDIYVYDETQEAANAGEDQNICAVGNTCTVLSANAVIAPGIGTWTQIDGLTSVTFNEINNPATMVCNMIPGVYVFQWCINNGPCGVVTCDQVTVTVYPSDTPPASVGPDVELCTPQTSVNMNASIANPPALGEWQLISGSGIISDDDNPQTSIHSLSIGENVFSWCVFNGACPNSGTCDTLSIFLFDENAQEAYAGEDQDLCESDDNIFLEANPVDIPGIGTWTALGPYSAAIVDIHDPNTELVDLGVGEYLFLWTVYNGPCASTNTTDMVRIRIYESSQAVASAGDDFHICTPQSAVTMQANNAIFPATSQWDALPGGSGAIASINNPSTQVTGLLPGISLFSWTIDNGPCNPSITTDTVSVYVYDTSIPPANAGPNQQFCAPIDLAPIEANLTGSIVQGAGTGLWTQVSGPSNATIATPSQNITIVSDLLVGEYVFRWSIQNGPCGVTQDDVSIFINDPNLPPAEAGPDVDYCTPVDSHQFTATPVAFPAIGTWSAFPPVPITPSLNDANATASNLNVGYQLFIWTVDNGACPGSSDIAQVRIYNEFQPSANAGADIELCLPQTEVNLSSTDIFDPAVGIWHKVSGCTDALIADVNDPNTLISQLCLGTQCFRWTVDNGPCPNGITVDTVCVRVYDPEMEVTVSEDQSICTPENTVTISGTEPQDPNTGSWSMIQGNGATIDIPTSATTEVTDLAVGINIFRWSFYNGSCDNQPFDDVTVNVYDQSHPWADAGEDEEMCFPQNSTTIIGNTPIVPAIGYWTLVSGSGDISSINSPQTEVSELAVGQNIFVWTIENGPCENSLMTDTVIIHVFPENPQTALGGPDMEICTPESSITLAATQPESPSFGTWEVVTLNGFIDDISNPTTTVDFLTVGIHTLNWTIDNGPCNSDNTDAVSIYVYDATAPAAAAGDDIELCSPDNEATMSANAAVSPGVGLWSFLSSVGSPEITDPSSPTTSITNLQIGITELVWRIDNGTCGITTDTLRITVFDPTSPSSSVSEDELICDVPACVGLQGSVPTAPAYGWWEQIAGDNVATITDATSNNTTACGLALNESAFVWHVYNGACSNGNSTDTIWFFIYDSQVAAANAGIDAAYCDPDVISHQLQGSELIGTVQGLATGTWTGTMGEIMNPNSNETIVNSLPPGVHCFTWTVDNGACGTTNDEVCITVYNQNQTPADAGVGVEICSNEFLPFYLNGNEPLAPATGHWSVIDGPAVLQGGDSYDAYVTSLGAIVTQLVDVNSTMVWTIDNGLCGTTSDTVVYVLLDCETIKIPDAFSPNGDGTNDVFYIPNIEFYTNSRLQIFNRWGSLVFVGAPYKNDWDGRSTHSATIGDELPVSTYYYVLSLGESYDEVPDKVFTGFVYLKR